MQSKAKTAASCFVSERGLMVKRAGDGYLMRVRIPLFRLKRGQNLCVETVYKQVLHKATLLMPHRQMVKAQDFDSCITGSNPVGAV